MKNKKATKYYKAKHGSFLRANYIFLVPLFASIIRLCPKADRKLSALARVPKFMSAYKFLYDF